MRNIIAHIACIAFAASPLLLSCTKQESVEEIQQSDAAISFNEPQLGWTTKGIDPLDNDKLKNFGICAALNFDEENENQWYLSQQPVIRDELDRTFSFNPPSYWPVFGDLSFFAYAPKFQNGNEEIPIVETTTGFPAVEFTPSVDNITGQIDFCIGRPLMHLTKDDNPITIQFEHALAQIMFYANYTGVIPPGFVMYINQLKIKNVVGTKSVSYSTTPPYYVWEDESARSADATYTLERLTGEDHIKTVSIPKVTGTTPETYQDVSNSHGRLYLVPQTLGPNAKLEVTYGFYANVGVQPILMALFTKEIALPDGQVWPGGKIVNYKLTVDVGISSPLQLDCTITDWVSSGNTHTQQIFE